MGLLDELEQRIETDEREHPARTNGLPELVPQSIEAQVLLDTWQGTSAIVVTSPPGAGKSRLLVTVGSHLAARGKMKVAVACQTNVQARDLANRYVTGAPATPTYLLGRNGSQPPSSLHRNVQYVTAVKDLPGYGVVIATTKKWQFVDWTADVLLVDESYQATWADFAAASVVARQAVLVGDPGQIAPVVTGDVRRYRRIVAAPHLPAPQVFAKVQSDMVHMYQLPDTWRCGPETAHVLQPLYDFTFGSQRAPKRLQFDGQNVNELCSLTVESHGPSEDPAIADAIVRRVRDILERGTLHSDEGVRAVVQDDIAVVAAHNAQVSALKSRLTDLPRVQVATTERLQGAEFPVVLAWSPFSAKRSLSEFDVELGRLCVMLSRHTHNLTFVERHDSRKVLHDSQGLFSKRTMERLTETLRRFDRAAQDI